MNKLLAGYVLFSGEALSGEITFFKTNRFNSKVRC